MAYVTSPGDLSLPGTNQNWYPGMSHWLGAWHGGAVYDILAGNRGDHRIWQVILANNDKLPNEAL